MCCLHDFVLFGSGPVIFLRGLISALNDVESAHMDGSLFGICDRKTVLKALVGVAAVSNGPHYRRKFTVRRTASRSLYHAL